MNGEAIDWGTVDLDALDQDAQKELFRRSRESLASDPYRPFYHFSPPGSDLHDAAGLCWWQGRYHLFYLFSTPHVLWARGHAVSEDLVHWRDLPVVKPAIHGGTGQVWADNDRVIMGYATHEHKAVSLATAADPLLLDWIEHPRNPVHRPGNDNYVWREGDSYFLTQRVHRFDQGLTCLSGRTTIELCRSDDLATWESMGHLFEDGYYTEPGEDCGCNNFLPISNGKHLLLFFSHKRSAQYYIGTYDREVGRFRIENHGRMNYGPVMRGSLHAPSGFVDPRGRCIGIWNVTENRPQVGWDQIMSLSRHLSLNEEGSDAGIHLNPLCIEPIAELESLRADPVLIDRMTVPANREVVLPGVAGKTMELEAVIDPMDAREVGLYILRSPDGEERTAVTLYMHGWRWDPSMRELAIDVSRASLDPAVRSRSPEIGPLYLEAGEPLRLRVFIDRSIVEVFANGRQCLTVRAYPSRDDSCGVSVFARGGEAGLVSLTAYSMQSIWPELKDREGR